MDLTLIINVVSHDYKNFTNCLWSFYDTLNNNVNLLISIPEFKSEIHSRIMDYGDINHSDFIKTSKWISPNSIKNLAQSISDTPLYLYIEDTTVFKDEYTFSKISEQIEVFKKDYLILNNKCVLFRKNFYFNSNLIGYGYENFLLNEGGDLPNSDLMYQRNYTYHDKNKMKENLDIVSSILNLEGDKRKYFHLQ